jgi:hypothetical protein
MYREGRAESDGVLPCVSKRYLSMERDANGRARRKDKGSPKTDAFAGDRADWRMQLTWAAVLVR